MTEHNQTPVIAKRRGHKFAPGHKYFPRKAAIEKTVRTAIQTAIDKGFEPIAMMIDVIVSGTVPEPDGQRTPVGVPIRMKLLREVAGYIVPKVATPVTGTVDHRHQHVDMTRIMMDPVLAAAAENLALALAEQEQLEAGQVQDGVFLPLNVYQNP